MAVENRYIDIPGPAISLEQIKHSVKELAVEAGKDASRRDLEKELPFALFEFIRERRIGTLRIPRALGGPGGSIPDFIECLVVLASGDPSVAHALRSHFNFVESLILDPDSAAAREYLPKVLAGALFAGAHTEQGGAKPGILSTRLGRRGDRFFLNGRKWYATGSAYADYLSFSALDDDGQMISALLPADREGITVLDDWDGMGQRLTASGGVLLENVEVFAHEIAIRSRNPLIARHASTLRQLHLAACAAGAIRNVFEEALAYVRDHARPANHSPAALAREDHFVQQVVGEIAANRYAIDALIADTARVLQASADAILAGDDAVTEARLIDSALVSAQTQLVLRNLGLKTAEIVFELGGGSATSRKYNFDRHWRNIRTVLNHNPLLHKSRVIGDYYLNGTTRHLEEGLVF